MSPIFFVHIPKTAGTSFRLGAEKVFPKDRIEYDYGEKSPVTTSLVKDYVHGGNRDVWEFRENFYLKGSSMIGGHVNARKYLPLFGAGNTVTFLREPLQRIYSEFLHFVRHYDYKGSFYDFYSRPHMHNRQTKMLQGVDVEAIGFVGLTERYSEGLDLFNDRYALSIPKREDNKASSKVGVSHVVSDEDKNEFERLNQQDIKLYYKVGLIFAQRYQMFCQGKAWAHARLTECKPGRVSGWAWLENSDSAVHVEVWANDEHVATVPAVEFRPGLCRHYPPRAGHVGFHVPVKLNVGDKVQCRVAGTGQYFPEKPMPVVKPEAK